MKNLLLASTSSLDKNAYLDYLLPEIAAHFNEVHELLFIPYARPGGSSYANYTQKVRSTFESLNILVKGIHETQDPVEAVKKAQGIFVGGGNTFLLVKELYDRQLLTSLRSAIATGVPYLGTSAGSNICGFSMQTTNDMPIVRPPHFKTLGSIEINLNVHYLDPDPSSTHQGETRQERIKEFHMFNKVPVLGLREGSWLDVKGSRIVLKGKLSARLFRSDKLPIELKPEDTISDYL